MTDQARAQLTALLVTDEGERLHAYTDTEGYLTIGVGRLIDARRGGGISHTESRYLLANDVARVEEQIRRNFVWAEDMSPTRQVVLASMVFQLGIGTVRQFTHTLTAMEEGRYADAARAMLESKWAREDTPARAQRLAQMMERG